MQVSGFTFVRNATLLDYPIEESIASLLPLVDELVINVPASEDDTLPRVKAIRDKKISVIESDWDNSLRTGGQILSQQTNRALNHCSGDWAFYLQADEVLHEDDYPVIRASLRFYLRKLAVDGLSFRFIHFEGGYGYYNPLRYRRQVRVIRNNNRIRSAGDACGFEKDGGSMLRTRNLNARVFHYGWARDPTLLLRKNKELERLYHDDEYLQDKYEGVETHDFADMDVCRPFRRTHPQVMRDKISGAGAGLEPPGTRLPYFLRPRVWRWLMKKWGVTKR